MNVPSKNNGSHLGSDSQIKSENLEFGVRLKGRRQKYNLSQLELATKIGASKNTIQRYESGELPKGNYLIAIADVLECSIDWLLRGDDYKDEYNKNSTIESKPRHINVIGIEHSDLIKCFKDKDFAKEINQDLLDLERIDPDAFKKVGGYIKGVVDGLKLASGRGVRPDRRKHQRRQNDSGKAPDGVDRRSGNDRRQTGT